MVQKVLLKMVTRDIGKTCKVCAKKLSPAKFSEITTEWLRIFKRNFYKIIASSYFHKTTKFLFIYLQR